MDITMDEILGRVLKSIDENEEILVDKMSAGYESASVSELIRMLAPGTAEEVILAAEWGEIDEWLELDADVDWVEPGRGEVELPEDFLRLMVFRMSDWRRAVRSTVDPGSGVYALRFTPGRHREGVRKAPMVALTGGEKRKRLEFIGSTDPGAYVERSGYLPRPQRSEEDVLWIPRSLVCRVVDAIAEKVKSIIN
ncbi:MAG: hypothetical protein HDS89_07595 [Bacteroidales bacterium]|nr:hypothetical protein [Bacteroidales bacterium]